MSTTLNPYLHFRGDAREALEFYRDALGGELTISTFGDFGAPPGVDPEHVMHGQLSSPAGTLMCGDLPDSMEYRPGTTMSVSLSGDDPALRGYWEKLSAGATVDTPLARQMWGDEFGSLTDRFGIAWLVNITGGA